MLVPAIAGAALLKFLGVCFASDTPKGFQERLDLPREPEPLLAEILARDEFKEPDSWWKLVDEIKDWLWEGFLDILEELFGLVPHTGPLNADPDILRTILTAILIGIILLVLIYAAKPFLNMVRRWSGGRVESESSAPAGKSPSVGSGVLWDRSQELAGEGRYGEALVHLFRFSLTKLDELGRLSYRTGRTNRELLESIREAGPLKSTLSEMVPIFNRVRYGDVSCGKSDYEHFLNLCLRAVERK